MRLNIVLVPVFVLCIVSPTAAQTVTVSGKTSRVDAGRYTGLGNIRIVVTRGNAVVTSETSKGDGSFVLNIQAGSPFTIAFYGEERVPELQQLSGESTTRNVVNVTLLTPTEYIKEFGGRLPLVQKLECDRRRLPDDAKEAQAYIQRMRAQLPAS